MQSEDQSPQRAVTLLGFLHQMGNLLAEVHRSSDQRLREEVHEPGQMQRAEQEHENVAPPCDMPCRRKNRAEGVMSSVKKKAMIM